MTSIRSALVVIVAGVLAGCSATPSQTALAPASDARSAHETPAQLQARGISPAFQAIASPAASHHGTSWMSPDAKKKSSLLYVADEATGDVDVYSYPQGKPEGTLTGFDLPTGICTSKAGDVYILNGGGSTAEVFAHGGTSPLRTLDLTGAPEFSCSVDQKTGNFAVGVIASGDISAIAVFAKGQGKAVLYEPSGQSGFPGCAYDSHSNLFCDAYGSGDAFALYELPKNGSNAAAVSVSGASGLLAGPMQWDGKDLAFGSGARGTLYQIALSGSTGSVQSSTSLTGTGWVWQFWIQGKRVIVPTYSGTTAPEVGYYKYPAGGSSTKAITGFEQPDGAAISTTKTQ